MRKWVCGIPVWNFSSVSQTCVCVQINVGNFFRSGCVSVPPSVDLGLILFVVFNLVLFYFIILSIFHFFYLFFSFLFLIMIIIIFFFKERLDKCWKKCPSKLSKIPVLRETISNLRSTTLYKLSHNALICLVTWQHWHKTTVNLRFLSVCLTPSKPGKSPPQGAGSIPVQVGWCHGGCHTATSVLCFAATEEDDQSLLTHGKFHRAAMRGCLQT